MFSATTEKRLALAGNPGDLRVADWLGIKAISSVVFAILFFLLFDFLLGTGFVIALLIGVAGIAFGYIAPEFWLGGASALVSTRSCSRSPMRWTCSRSASGPAWASTPRSARWSRSSTAP